MNVSIDSSIGRPNRLLGVSVYLITENMFNVTIKAIETTWILRTDAVGHLSQPVDTVARDQVT